MTLTLTTLEESIKIIETARLSLSFPCTWGHSNPAWLKLWHAEMYLQREFKTEFNQLFEIEETNEC